MSWNDWTEKQKRIWDRAHSRDDMPPDQARLFAELFAEAIEIIERADAEREKDQVSSTPEERTQLEPFSPGALYHTSPTPANLPEVLTLALPPNKN